MTPRPAGRVFYERAPVKWQELSVKVPREYVEPVSYLFSRYGRGLSTEVAEEGHVLLRTYLTSTSRQRLARIEVGINLIRVIEPFAELVVKDLDSTDWETAWKAHFSLFKLGTNLVVKPPWIQYEPRDEEIVIELDPGMAFGTGYHPTTKMCLEALESSVQPGMEVLDMGTGSGILSIAAAKMGAESVVALDTDPIAVSVARKNFKSTGLSHVVKLERGTLPHRLAPEGCFDVLTVNISATVIIEKAPLLLKALKPAGTVVASGFVERQQRDVEEAFARHGFTVRKARHLEDWVNLLLSRS